MPIRSVRPLLKLCAAVTAIVLLFDVLLFRSGVYYGWIEPDSTAGSVVGATRVIERYYDASRKNVLVLGDSRIGEGFSASLADAASGRDDLHFVNGSIAGTTPRVWNYLLRAVDADARRFAAIALMVEYDASTVREDMGNYSLDTNYAAPLLRAGDLFDYPSSFSQPLQRERARRAILFPLAALHDDVRDLLAHPLKRLQRVTRYRPGWIEAVGTYAGRDGALPPLAIDAASGMPTDTSALDADIKPRVDAYFHDLPARASADLQRANAAYFREWLGRIAQRYRARGVPVIVFAVPRGPWHRDLAPLPVERGALRELIEAGQLQALPGTAFVDLEQPQFFFDTLHMNRAGRERFSRLLAQQIAPRVP